MLETPVTSSYWHCLDESKKHTSPALFPLFLGPRVVRVRGRSSYTVVLSFSSFHVISGQSKGSALSVKHAHAQAFPQHCCGLSWTHWMGSSPILGTWHPCTFCFSGVETPCLSTWPEGMGWEKFPFCPFGLWSSYPGRPIKCNQRLINFKWISPCNHSSLTATINLNSTVLSFCVWLAGSSPICPLSTSTPAVLQAVQ